MAMECPSEATLRSIGADALGDEVPATLEAHVEACAECRGVLERIARYGWQRDELAEALLASPEHLPTVPGFVVERELGRGSAGVVYLAHEPGLERQVALKVVPGGTVAGPRGRARWVAEARAVSRVSHPNVVRLYRVEETPEWRVLVFEYIPGGTLKDRLDGPIDPRAAATLMELVALAIVAVHERGLLHLDLKPSNILLDGEPGLPLGRLIPKISDFGIARTWGDDLATEGSLGPRGTPSYMAPEQALSRGPRIGPPTDVFALGAFLYHLLTGRPPFLAGSIVELVDKLRYEQPAPPRRIDGRIPKDLEAICLRCLRKNPDDRYPSARALADDLRNWLDGRPLAQPAGLGGGRIGRRRLGGAALVSLAVLIPVVAASSPRWLGGAPPAPAREPAETQPSLAELRAWIRQMVKDPAFFEGERLAAFMRATRRHTAELKVNGEIDAENLASLGILQRVLAMKFATLPDRLEQARILLDESIDLLDECCRRNPDDQELLWELSLSLLYAGDLPLRNTLVFEDELAHFTDENIRRSEQAVALVRSLRSQARRLSVVAAVADSRRNRSNYLRWRGEPEIARRVLEADLAMFAAIDPSDASTPDIRLRKALTIAALRPTGESFDLRPYIAGEGKDWVAPSDRDQLVQEWIFLKFARPIFSEDGSFPSGADPAPDDDRADRLLSSIQRDCRASGVEVGTIPDACLYQLSLYVHSVGTSMRKAKRSADLARIERRFMACARALIRAYPGRPEPYMVLSEAYMQSTKNAWNRNNSAEAVAALRLARDAARQASGIAPEHLKARDLVEDREQRLARSIGE